MLPEHTLRFGWGMLFIPLRGSATSRRFVKSEPVSRLHEDKARDKSLCWGKQRAPHGKNKRKPTSIYQIYIFILKNIYWEGILCFAL